MSNCGMHLPNREFEGDDWARIKALGVRHYVDLHHFRGRWGQIKAEQPDALIHARIDVRGDLGDPGAEAADLARLVAEQGQLVATWRHRNEPNLESPGVTPERWRRWLADFGRAIEQRAPAARVYAPAVSPGTPDWIAWLDATAEGAREGGLDGLDVHAYGSPAEVRSVIDAHRARWPGPLLVTEHNFGAGRAYDLARYAADLPAVTGTCAECGVEAVCLFIWQWRTPDMSLPTSVDVKGTPIEHVIPHLPHHEPAPVARAASTTSTAPAAGTLDRQKLKAYHEWAAARLAASEDPRDPAAFVEHLRALGADWRQPAEYGLPSARPDGRPRPGEPLERAKLKAYHEWAAARLAANEDPRDADSFLEHLRALGADWRDLHAYGLPFSPVAEPRVLDTEGVDLWPLIKSAAERHGVQPVAVAAMLRAESDLNPRAERWGDRTPAAKQNIQNPTVLEQIVKDLENRRLGADISFGLCQMIVRTAKGYGIGDGTNSIANILEVRRRLFDRTTAIEVGTRHLAGCMRQAGRAEPDRAGDALLVGGLVVYNAGRLPAKGDPWWQVRRQNVRRYEQALDWAHSAIAI